MSEFIRIDAVSKRFRTSRSDVLALDTVSLSIEKGEFVVFLGPSGCGKSTLLRILAGLTTSTTGEIRIGGEVVFGPHPSVGMVFQSYTSFPWLRVSENVAFGLELAGMSRNERRRKAGDIIDRVGLTKFADRYPSQLSGGMQQRLAIARALAIDPAVLLMDEPFGALDILIRVNMQSFLVDLWSQDRKTLVFVTHDIDEAILLADRIVVMSPHPGRIADIVPITIARPRTIEMTEEPEFVLLRHRLRSMIFGMQGDLRPDEAA